jgi:hypothetical protein
MSRGFGRHQRRILEALNERGWIWMAELPTKRTDGPSYWRAARKLETQGRLRIEHRKRRGWLRKFAILIRATQSRLGTALPLDEEYWSADTSYE